MGIRSFGKAEPVSSIATSALPAVGRCLHRVGVGESGKLGQQSCRLCKLRRP